MVTLQKSTQELICQSLRNRIASGDLEPGTELKQVELANQNYSVVQNRYQNDLALLTDMVDASNMKLSAEMALVNARIDLLYHFYKLKYVTNTL